MRVRHSLAIPTALVLAALATGTLAAGYLVGSRALTDALQRLEQTRLRALYEGIRGRLDAELAQLRSVTAVVAHDRSLAALVAASQPDGLDLELQEHLDAVQERSRLGILFVADSGGRVLYSGGTTATPILAVDDWGLEEALHGVATVAAELRPSGWQVRGFEPLTMDGRVVGVLAGGFRLDAALMDQVVPSSGVRVGLATRDGLVAGGQISGVSPEIRGRDIWRTLTEERQPWFAPDPVNHRSFYYSPIRLADDTFCLVVEADAAAAEAVLSRERKLLGRSLGILLGVVGALGVPALYLLLAPLRRLRGRVLQKSSAFVPDACAGAVPGNEIETLEAAFDGLLGAVEEHVESRAASEAKARAVVDASPVGIAVVARGRVRFANGTLRRMFGAGPSEVRSGAPGRNFVAAGDRLRVRRELGGGGRHDGPGAPVAFDAVAADGRAFPALAWSSPVAWDGGEALLVFVTETTEIEELRSRLSGAEKMELVGTLAGGVAHDLNNMLGAIVAYPDLLLPKLPEDSPLRQPIVRIQDAALRAARVVEDLMTLTRRRVRVTAPVDLAAVVAACLAGPEGLDLTGGRPEVRLDTALVSGGPRVEGSAVHLANLVMNLCRNAFEALPGAGSVTLQVQPRTANEVPPGGDDWHGPWVALAVADDGVGIRPEDLERIYEPFYTKKVLGRRSGTGLGMAVVWETVRDHGGMIDARSRPGQGTRFTVYLPARAAPAADEAPPPDGVDVPRGVGQAVLLVDDEASQREIGGELLRHLGYEVRPAESGEVGVARFAAEGADLVVLDMIMDPGIGGLDTFRRLREIDPEVRAVIASGDASPGLVERALALGVKGYVKKPFTLEQLAVAVRDGLRT